MFSNNVYYKYSDFLFEKYKEKTYKLPINLPVTCPNRLNQSGCSFCADNGTGFESQDCKISVTRQLELNHELISKKYKAKKFIAYFQNFTNTFLPLEEFKDYITQAATFPDLVELAISTRPDCIRNDYLDFLKTIQEKYSLNIVIELGLQTANYHTLDQINRGHGLAEYIDAVLRIHSYGFEICTHVILNLPGDTERDAIETAKILSVLPISFVKIHSLYIPKHSEMAQDYLQHKFTICSKEEYYHLLAEFLTHLRPDIAVERLFGRIPEEDSIFSNWNTSWWKLQDEFIAKMLQEQLMQGKRCHYMNGPALALLTNNKLCEEESDFEYLE